MAKRCCKNWARLRQPRLRWTRSWPAPTPSCGRQSCKRLWRRLTPSVGTSITTRWRPPRLGCRGCYKSKRRPSGPSSRRSSASPPRALVPASSPQTRCWIRQTLPTARTSVLSAWPPARTPFLSPAATSACALIAASRCRQTPTPAPSAAPPLTMPSRSCEVFDTPPPPTAPCQGLLSTAFASDLNLPHPTVHGVVRHAVHAPPHTPTAWPGWIYVKIRGGWY
mmetsp:Transcript_1508/g.4372  ORF Transcript_1508/g.4372 Transcript_1508/m.4372 type:complete len:223 (-) Transcript_1508:9-677(-)